MDAAELASFIDSLDAALQLFKQPPSQQASTLPRAHGPEDKEQLNVLLERVRADISKVGILCSDGASPSGRDLSSLAGAFVQSCLATVTFLHAHASSAGPSLKDSLGKSAAALIEPATDLLRAMGGAAAGQTSLSAIKSAVGHCWGAIDACKAAPLDNKASIFKNVTTVLLSMKDAVREMTELQQQTAASGQDADAGDAGEQNSVNANSANANGHSNGNGHLQQAGDSGSEGGDDDMVDFEAGQLSGCEARTLAAARQLVEAAGKVLRTVSKPLLRGPPVNTDSGLEAWENVLWHARALQKCCEDLGAAMYPPQEEEEVRGAAEGVFNSSTLLLCEIPEDYAEQLREEAAGLEQQLELANQRLLAALQAEQ